MLFTLIIEDQDGHVETQFSFDDGEFIIGRSHSSDIILPSDNVSRRHARLFTQDGRCFVEDLASSNGVFVNGERIHRATEVAHAAQIKVGDYYLHVEGASHAEKTAHVDAAGTDGTGDSIQDTRSATEERIAFPHADPGGGEIIARLIGSSESVRGQVFDVTRAVSLVGRGKDCAVTIIDASISRVHAKLLRNQDGSITIEDLRSSNGSYVNDQRVEQATFGHGDRLRFGNIEFMVELPGFGAVEHVEVSSGGRRWALAGVVFLLICIVTGVTLWVQSDSSAPSEQVQNPADTAEEPAVSQDVTDAEELEAQYERASDRLDKIIKRAEKLAAKDDWAAAEAILLKGKQTLDENARLDTKGELTARFETAETRLRSARADYKRLLSALAEKDYKQAGVHYTKAIANGGPFATAASAAIQPEKTRLVSSGDALYIEKLFGKCLDYYQQAKLLDPTDANLAQKVAELRIKIVEGKSE